MLHQYCNMESVIIPIPTNCSSSLLRHVLQPNFHSFILISPHIKEVTYVKISFMHLQITITTMAGPQPLLILTPIPKIML